MTRFPIPAPAYDGRSRSVEIGAVFAWLRFGWSAFLLSPGVWIASAAILLVGALALLAVWLLGPLLGSLLAPVLAAGLLSMARHAATGEPIGIRDLGAGFTERAGALISIGLIFMVAMLVIKLFIVLLFSGSVAGGMMMPGAVGLGVLLGGSLFALLLSSLLLIPLTLAMWFAPALVLFNGMPAVDACRASFAACLKNLAAFLVLGLIFAVLSFFAALPMGLGFLVLIPVTAGTAYASYQDVFVAR